MGKDISLLEEISNKLTEKTLRDILVKKTGKESVEVTGWEFEPGSNKGDNYLSIVYRVTIDGIVDGENIHTKVVIKGLPHNEATRKTFRSAEFFSNEVNFYVKVIPKIDEFLRSKNVNYNLPVPRCFGCYCDGKHDYVILEDARELGYGHIPRHDIWTPEDIQIILRCLARFHAVSFAYKDQYPSEFDEVVKNLSETYYDERNWSWYETWFTNCIAVAKDAVSKEYKNTPEAQKFLSLSSRDLWERATKAIADKSISIVTQGDSWPSNFMVCITEEKREALMLDFQLARCNTIITDVSNFIYTSTDKEIRDKHLDNLLKYYYEQLSSSIALLGTDPNRVFPWDVFMKEKVYQ
ncbi:uncharacterized protein [Chelonus insularis]|uniref:uncharacterized protein isoform X2 n=1 Tax=Chelonus insularis TaxID=460826 RepID=UPI00158AB40F|nr:uncharacterized protein LOC118067623 isoform X2 [Chelonus insularis]